MDDASSERRMSAWLDGIGVLVEGGACLSDHWLRCRKIMAVDAVVNRTWSVSVDNMFRLDYMEAEQLPAWLSVR